MQKLRSWLKKEWPSLNLAHQTRWRLMMLKDVAVVSQCVDVRQAGTLRKKITNRDLVGSRNIRYKIAYMLVQAD